MTNSKQPINPIKEIKEIGLTKREYFALELYKSMLLNSDILKDLGSQNVKWSEFSVRLADELIYNLNN